MDNFQTSLKKASAQIIASLNDRVRLKSLLSDCLSGNKLQINLLLNAYDNDFAEKLLNSTTVTDQNLFLNRLVQSLTGDYGITEQAALWAIDSWCIILNVAQFSANAKTTSFTVNQSHDSQQINSSSTNAISGISQSVLDKLLENDDYIDLSLSMNGVYYIIRSPSNEKKAGISFDGLEIKQDPYFSLRYCLKLEITRKIADKGITALSYLYSDKGSYMEKTFSYPDLDHYTWDMSSVQWPGKKFTKPFFIRLLFGVR